MTKEELALKLSIAYLNRTDKNISEKEFYESFKKSKSEFSEILLKDEKKGANVWDVM